MAIGAPWELLVADTAHEALLLQRDRQNMKVWCGNRYCLTAGLQPTRGALGPWVQQWMDNGKDKVYREYGIKSFAALPAYDGNGDRNLYCPTCGESLISECGNCGRAITSGAHKHCTGCGKSLWKAWEIVPDRTPQPSFLDIRDDDVPF
jgi:hypothetical protein